MTIRRQRDRRTVEKAAARKSVYIIVYQLPYQNKPTVLASRILAVQYIAYFGNALRIFGCGEGESVIKLEYVRSIRESRDA